MKTKFKKGDKVKVVATAEQLASVSIVYFDTMIKILKNKQTIANVYPNGLGEVNSKFTPKPMYITKTGYILPEKFLKK